MNNVDYATLLIKKSVLKSATKLSPFTVYSVTYGLCVAFWTRRSSVPVHLPMCSVWKPSYSLPSLKTKCKTWVDPERGTGGPDPALPRKK